MATSDRQGNTAGEGREAASRTHLIPAQARQPVAPVAATSPYRSRQDDEDLQAIYTIREKIGSGGMGTVYVALDRRLNRFVAIKRLKAELREEVAVRRRFLHEARAAAALNNVHIVHIYSIGEDSEGPYIVMEYVESALPKTDPGGPCPPQTLEQYVSRNGPFKLDDGIVFMLKVGHAMQAAHAAGVIHRDLKSANILLDAAGEPKIVDFGLARLTRPDASTALTVTGDTFVSLGYAAPEQESDATLTDERADVYGLGALLFFILTGKNPRFFREEDLPTSVRPIVCKALATDRDARYQTVASLTAALNTLLVESKTERPTIKTTWRCKWCDTVNPLSTRFCAECGWDGREQCPECGEDQQFGTPFCGVCGANVREYENAETLLRKVRAAIESRQYEWAVNYASQPMTFEPVGPNGRRMLEEIQSLCALARQRHQRREQLRAVIHTEIASENYERAQRFIQEFRELSPGQDAFSEELRVLPVRMWTRDLLRVRKAFESQDWDLGERLLHSMRATDLQDETELRHLQRRLARHKRRITSLRAVAGLGVIVLAYLLIMPALIRLNVPGTRMLGQPVRFLLHVPALRDGLARYAVMWGIADLNTAIREGVQSPFDTTRLSGEILDSRRQFEETRSKAAALHTRAVDAWQADYLSKLESLSGERQREGDFIGLQAARDEITRFERTPSLSTGFESEFPHLTSLRERFRARRKEIDDAFARAVAVAADNYDQALSGFASRQTKAGEIDTAASAMDERRRLARRPDVSEARARLAE